MEGDPKPTLEPVPMKEESDINPWLTKFMKTDENERAPPPEFKEPKVEADQDEPEVNPDDKDENDISQSKGKYMLNFHKIKLFKLSFLSSDLR